MEKEEIIKKTWETPEIVDLDLDKTKSGASASTSEITPFAHVS